MLYPDCWSTLRKSTVEKSTDTNKILKLPCLNGEFRFIISLWPYWRKILITDVDGPDESEFL